MRALLATDAGPPDKVLELAEIPPPAPGPGEVLVQVEAAALNPVDLYLITGRTPLTAPAAHPYVVGTDASGLVAALGPGVAGLALGDAVLGFAPRATGTLAEYAVLPVGPYLARRPDELDAVHAAALPLAGLTAVHLAARAAVRPGDRALVVGATGGVGTYLVQLLVRAGAEVVATASEGDAALVIDLGAAIVIDHTAQHVAEETLLAYPGGVDLVVDLVHAGADLAGSARAARPGGRVLSPLHGPPVFAHDVAGVYLGQLRPEPGALARLADRAASGILHVEVGARYPVDQAVRAVTEFATGHVRGKTVVTF